MIQLRNSFVAGGIAVAVALSITANAASANILHARRAAPPSQFTVYTTGEWENPLGATPGADGNVWFTVPGSTGHQSLYGLLKMTPQGQAQWFSTGDPAVAYPFAIVTAGDGNLWFTDTGNEVIYRMTPQGDMLGSYSANLPGPNTPAGLALAPDGSMYFVSNGPGAYVGHIDLFGTITEIAHVRSDLMADPSIAYNGGNLYFTARSLHSGDQFLVTVASSGKPSLVRTGLTASRVPWHCCVVETPQSIATASDGSVWFTNVRYVDHKGDHPIGHLAAGGLHFYHAPIPWMGSVTPGPNGDMWIAGQDPLLKHGMLASIGPKGATRAFPLPSETRAIGIAVGPDGNVWMSGSNSSGSVVIKATP